MTAAIEDRLSETFSALANSTRPAILARLAEGAATVNELAAPFEMKLPAISKHIKVLERAGLGGPGPTGAVPTVRPRRRPTRGGLDLGRALPARLGDPLRPDRRVPHTTPITTKDGHSTMTADNAAQDDVVIERSFDAPVEVIWQMWTDPEHFKAWYRPDGASIPIARMDVRVGGTRQVCMEIQTPNGPMQMWFTGKYRAVVVNERLVYTESMSDENGNVKSPADMGMPEGHPTTTEIRVELEDVGGTTKMVMTHVGIPRGSPGAAGWTMAFDKLAAHVEAHGGR